MITARLRESVYSPELFLESYRLVLREAYREKEILLKQARKRARSYIQHARRLGHESGYAAGEKECVDKFISVIESLKSRYDEASRLAGVDVAVSASELVEEMLESRVTSSTAPLQTWIQTALQQVSTNRVLVLRYHPKYEEILGEISRALPKDIRCEADPSLGAKDFVLHSELGAVECSWRELVAFNASTLSLSSRDT